MGRIFAFRQRQQRRGYNIKIKPGSEFANQVEVARFIDDKLPGILWTATVGGMRVAHPVIAIKMRMAGYKRGCPDILIFDQRRSYKGFALEMKNKDGLKKFYRYKDEPETHEYEQAIWLHRLEDMRWLTMVSDDVEAVKEKLRWYFNKEREV